MDGSRILVGTDFSDGSSRALEMARRFADRLGARIEIVHVVERFANGDWRSDAAAGWLADARLDASSVTIRSGFPWVELVRLADEMSPAMIVVGSHGSSGFQPLTMGSTASRLGILSPYPVLVVTTGGNGRRNARPAMPARSADRGSP